MKSEFSKTVLVYRRPKGKRVNFKRKRKELRCITAIIQDAKTKKILMLAFMNKVAWDKTQKTKIVHFWSRSRDELWRKGATSGNEMEVVYQRLNCDCTAVLIGVRVLGDGVACHTGKISCFYNRVL